MLAVNIVNVQYERGSERNDSVVRARRSETWTTMKNHNNRILGVVNCPWSRWLQSNTSSVRCQNLVKWDLIAVLQSEWKIAKIKPPFTEERTSGLHCASNQGRWDDFTFDHHSNHFKINWRTLRNGKWDCPIPFEGRGWLCRKICK